MPRFLPLYLHRLLRDDGRRRRFVARHRRLGFGERRRFDGRRYGAGRYIGRRHGAGGYRARRHSTGRFRGQGIRNRSGAGPATGVAPLSMPSAPLAPQAPGVLALAAPPPAFWCSAHGWVICPLHEYNSTAGVDAVGQLPTSVFEFGGTSSAATVDTDVVAPRLPPPTPAVVEMEGDALAYMSAPTEASIFAFGSGVRSFTSAAVDDSVAPHLPSPTPATPPPSPRTRARRRLRALGLPLPSLPAASSPGSRGRRAGSWSPTALRLANGAAPGTQLPGGSSDEDARDGRHR